MYGNRIPIILAAAVALACTETATAPTAQSDGLTLRANVGGRVAHRVSVGGPDACEGFGLQPGCDANFSILAIQWTDGSSTGEYIDRFAEGGGFHADVNCLNVIGNTAWISGVLTQPAEAAGVPVITRVRDMGTSANDPPDLISFSFIGNPTSCNARPPLPLFPAPQGQVKVD